ncbi:MAG TPA: protein translocase subunit SecD [Gammaproteobacteria bacterium]|nr:protein translocase subunit SecD [Gammaproteobacteria bacterium]
MNQYPTWKYLLILFTVLIGAIYALPNIYGSNPALQISATRTTTVDTRTEAQLGSLLKSKKIPFRSMRLGDDGLLIRFSNVEQQLKASDLVKKELGDNYTVALNLAPASPTWLTDIHALPMYLGLDLRGGLHFLMAVDTETVIRQAYERYSNDFRGLLRGKKIRYLAINQHGQTLKLKFRTAALRDQAKNAIRSQTHDLTLHDEDAEGAYLIIGRMTKKALHNLELHAVQQNVITLRNRVNELGVAEPVIQQQGDSHIVVQLPGIQDSARAKKILSATATLEFRLVDVDHTVASAQAGHVPPGSRLYRERNGRYVLLKKRVIITGDRITHASSGFDQNSGSPTVMISLDGAGARSMARTTKENLKKPMAVVFIEHKPITLMVDGKKVATTRKVEEVINVATIQGVFSSRFQITGLSSPKESQNLALLLRAGALAAPIRIVEERTIGPSLGQDNIDRGTRSVIIGMLMVVVFMGVWYRGFGMVANLALVMNLVLIVALLSLLQATLTMPGIAGIVLTVGMAVDANVLIFERIREELRLGNTPQSSIQAGYDKALSTIADANITTLIAAVVLYIFGTGPIKGFAITLSIGIVTSLFTAIMGTRAIINLIVGGRRIKKLSI